MKRKFLTVLLALVATLCLCFGLAACGGGDGNGGTEQGGETEPGGDIHTHSAKYFQVDDSGHWKVCADCGEKFSVGSHDYNSDNACATCGYSTVYTKGLEYALDEDTDTYTVTGLGEATDTTDLIIPAYYEGKAVTAIGEEAFKNCSGLTSIVIPNGVTSIGNWAFYGCYKLVEVWNYSRLRLQPGSYDYGEVACYAKHVYTTDEESKQTVTEEGYIFYEDGDEVYLLGYKGSETALTLPSTSPKGKSYKIYQYAFYNCDGLTSVTIGSGVTTIGKRAFYGCYKLVEVWNYSELELQPGSFDYGYVAYCAKHVYTTDEVSKQNVTEDDGYIFYEDGDEVYLLGYKGNKTALTLPATSPKGKAYKINQWAFYDCSGLMSVTIGNGVTSIGSSAFSGCRGLTSITIPDSVTLIRDYAFNGCDGLTGELKIPDSVTSIGEYAFRGCKGLTGELIIPAGVTVVGLGAFEYCSGLERVTIGSGVTEIGIEVFYGCSGLTSVEIPDSVTSIKSKAFLGCSGLTSVTIGSGVKSIWNIAFADCSGLTSVIWNAENCTEAGSSGFPIFRGCTSLKTVTFGVNVEIIPAYAFYGCSGLTDIQFKGTVKEWQGIEKKERDWDYETGEYTVTCTDGTVTKSGKVTYFRN